LEKRPKDYFHLQKSDDEIKKKKKREEANEIFLMLKRTTSSMILVQREFSSFSIETGKKEDLINCTFVFGLTHFVQWSIKHVYQAAG
jgi:hypothetical protein